MDASLFPYIPNPDIGVHGAKFKLSSNSISFLTQGELNHELKHQINILLGCQIIKS